MHLPSLWPPADPRESGLNEKLGKRKASQKILTPTARAMVLPFREMKNLTGGSRPNSHGRVQRNESDLAHASDEDEAFSF